MKVIIIELKMILSKISKNNIVIITEPSLKNTIFKINNEYLKINTIFIYACSLGHPGFLFNNFGKNHIISSPLTKMINFIQ
jgi:hypothetical protein